MNTSRLLGLLLILALATAQRVGAETCLPTDALGRACIVPGRAHVAPYSRKTREWSFRNHCDHALRVVVTLSNGSTDDFNVSPRGSATAHCFEERGCTSFSRFEVSCYAERRSGGGGARESRPDGGAPPSRGAAAGPGPDGGPGRERGGGSGAGSSAGATAQGPVSRQTFLVCDAAMKTCLDNCLSKNNDLRVCNPCGDSFRGCLTGQIEPRRISTMFSGGFAKRDSQVSSARCECEGKVGFMWCSFPHREFQCVARGDRVAKVPCPGNKC